MSNTNHYCVILAGGIGTRLWPASRQLKPKQFIDFLGNGETLLQKTYKRFSAFIDKENILVMSNHQYRDMVVSQLPELSEQNLLLEPMRRNTVPSVVWAAIEIARRNPNANMIVTPADQIITQIPQFEEAVLKGLDYADKNRRLLTLGILPTRPATTYGYIQMGQERDRDIFEVKSFTEKPELEFAQIFMENREFLWNTGLFICKATTFEQTMHKNASAFADMLDEAKEEIIHGGDVLNIVNEAFARCPNVSLEQGVLEKLDNVDVMLCHFDWVDIGTWNALYEVLPKADGSNVTMGSRTMLYDCEDCIVKLPSGKVAVLQGLKDYVVVEDGDVLVVCKKDDQSAIRKFVNDVQINLGDEYV